MISIVIPLYNKEKQIKNTLESVLNQTFHDFEVVIVNDGSTDASVEVVREFTDNRIRLIHQKNQGVSAARNKGIQEAKYDYVALLDADDEWKPEYLQTQIDLINKYPECRVYACAYEIKHSDGTISQIILNKIPFAVLDGVLANYFEIASCSHPPLWTSAVVVTKEAFLSVGGFPIGVKSGEDLLTWARLACQYLIAYCVKPLVSFNLDDSHSLTSTPSRLHDEKDEVGDGLLRLYLESEGKVKVDLKKYISLWYKMRASVFLRLFDRKNAIKYSIKSLKYNCFNWKVYFFVAIVLLPSRVQLIIRNKYAK